MSNGLKAFEQFDLNDLESVRLILFGDSVVDWQKLHFNDLNSAETFLRTHELNPNEAEDRRYIRSALDQAISYLKRNFSVSIPASVENASLEELLVIASGPSGPRRQVACTILKVVQIIHHTCSRELMFRLPVSDRDLFHLVEEKVYRFVGSVLSAQFPIVEFVGGRKNLDSTYTKLLSKPEASAVAIYDKLRFRIVTEKQEDILPILRYMTEHLFPFNYAVPSQSKNTMFQFAKMCTETPSLAHYVKEFQGDAGADTAPNDNSFSAADYRSIQFVTDIPVRVPSHILELAPSGGDLASSVVCVLCEMQLVDAESDRANEKGNANHAAYKARQREAVAKRLQLGPNSTNTDR